MEQITVPKLTVTFEVTLDLDYDPFVGRTTTQVAAALEDELNALLYEASPDVTGVSADITSIELNDWLV